MRLWSLHPRYLDTRGLVALWREALLAQAVLAGQTRGYTHHPQLIRFRHTASPLTAIAAYLEVVQAEAVQRGYKFDKTKIGLITQPVVAITVTHGQLVYEWEHLKAKLQGRAPTWLAQLPTEAEAHPLFQIIPGEVAPWEIKPTPKR